MIRGTSHQSGGDALQPVESSRIPPLPPPPDGASNSDQYVLLGRRTIGSADIEYLWSAATDLEQEALGTSLRHDEGNNHDSGVLL